MTGQFGRIKNDFSRAEAYAKQAAIREIHYVETLHWKKALVIFFIGLFLGFAVSNFAHASGMTANANYNPANVTITGGTINAVPVTSIQNPNNVAITGGTISASTINAATSQSLNGKLIMSATAPTIASGFGTGPSISASNGTAAFEITVGSGGTANTGTVTMPSAPTGWACRSYVVGSVGSGRVEAIEPTSTTLITFGTSPAWVAGSKITASCVPF